MMELLDHVRELRTDESHVDPQHLTTARGVLAQEIATTRPRTARTRRHLGWGLGLGGLSAATVGTLVVVAFVGGSVVAPPPGTVPAASASEVLQQAAESVLTRVSAADTALAPGQYLRIQTTRESVWTDGSSSDVAPTSAAFSNRNVTVLYVPADRSDDWIRETMPEEITGIYGPDGEAFLRNIKADPTSIDVGIESIPAGVETFGDTAQPIDMYRDSYAEMPRDPGELLAWFEKSTDAGYAGLAILNALYQNLPPAELRAAMLGALARISSFTLVSEEGNLATIQNTRAEFTQQFVIDTDSGLIVSIIDPRRHENDVVPVGMPDAIQTFDMSVVDSAPTPSD